MNIAFITYEYPPDTADGGIATYMYQAAHMMQERGHHVEVFSASGTRNGTGEENGLLVHRLHTEDAAFCGQAARAFAARHQFAKFDVLEGPEYGADAREAVRLVPDIPFVIKLHTPTFMIERMNFSRRSLAVRARFYGGAVRRGIPAPWHPEYGGERLHTLDADEIQTPSLSLGEEVARIWKIDPACIQHVPYPYVPAPALLEVPPDTDTQTVTFLGRLEVRKGVLDLAAAIPLVLRDFPQARFRFVGKPLISPHANQDMRQYLERHLRPQAKSVEFCDPVPLAQVPSVLANTDICVFPSLWENFPNVCLESMAAARGVVGSAAGGMAEMLAGGQYGLVVPPRNPRKLARAICSLLANPARRKELGRTARARVLSEYTLYHIGALQEAGYQRAIEHRRRLGPRTQAGGDA